jgi:tetratricopeptide (TPR) repeat protein
VDAELGQVVYSAANALVAAMATDGWSTAKGRLGRWLKRHRRGDADGPDDTDAVLVKLEDLRAELMSARNDPGRERFWRLYEELQAALTLRLAMVTAGDGDARAELERLHAEWLQLPGVSARSAGSSAHLARAYGELLVEPRGSGAAPALPRRPAAIAPGRPVRNLAPPTTARFIDREELLTRLQARIERPENATRIVNLCGEGGIGKTALAVKLWELVASSFPHGLLYADLRGSTGESAVEPGSVHDRFLRALDIDASAIPGDEQARLDLYRGLTAELDLVLLLDDAASVAQVRPLISASPGSLTIVTSRDPLQGLVQEYGATVVRIPPLDDANSLRLLRAVAGLDDPADSFATPVSAAELEARVRRCAGLPIAVCIEAARLAVGDLDQSAEATSPAAQSSGPDLLAGYRDLPPEAVRLHRLLCAHPWPSVTAGPAAAAAGVDDEATAAMLNRLFQANLLERAPGSTALSPRYRVHDRVREEACRRVGTVAEAAEAVAATRAIVCWYLAFAVLADWQVIARWHLGPLYEPLDERRRAAERTGVPEQTRYADKGEALKALESELDNLVEAVRAADRHLFYDLVCQLCEAQWSVLFRRGHHQEWIAVHRLGVKAAVETGDRRMEARMHVQLAFGLMGQDRLADAEQEFELGLAADRAAGHDQGLATALESLGLLALGREYFERAAELFAEARTVAERIGNPRALALLEHHYGRALSGLGRFDEAQVQFDRAAAAFRALRTRDEYNEGRVLMSRGEAALRAGLPERAREVLAEAAGIMAAEKSLVMQAQVAVLRAWCARESGDLAAERVFLVEAQDLHTRTGSRLAPRVGERIRFLDAAGDRLG